MTIHNIEDLATYLGIDVKSLKKDIYNGTDCGAIIEWDNKSVTISSIVEGSDAKFSKTLKFPFNSDSYDTWIEELEVLTNKAWEEINK